MRPAPAPRAFWSSSVKMSGRAALKKRVTRAMAPPWTRVRTGAGTDGDAGPRSEWRVMWTISDEG